MEKIYISVFEKSHQFISISSKNKHIFPFFQVSERKAPIHLSSLTSHFTYHFVYRFDTVARHQIGIMNNISVTIYKGMQLHLV